MITDNQEHLNGKTKYIGVKGAFTMMLVKTPSVMKNSRLALTSPFYPFYSPKTESSEE